MKKYIIVNNNQFAGGNSFMSIRKSINHKNVINLNICKNLNREIKGLQTAKILIKKMFVLILIICMIMM